MRIIPFPQPAGAPEEPTLAAIEAALHGDAVGEDAEQWRDLCADVRALAPPLPPGLERRLRERIEQREPASRVARATRAKLNSHLGASQRRRAAALAGALLVVVLLVVVAAASWRSGSGSSGLEAAHTHAAIVEESSGSSAASGAVAVPHAAKQQLVPFASEAVSEGPNRIQQRAASLTLAAKPAEVQSLSDRVAQLAMREGGVVESSQVHLERGTAGEADLHLSVPSAHLSTALASLARLAPTRA
ncbi:MAG TPA: hypothetical protein VK761_09575, partial [Solirubrobacteraceae bacterium]|nr:hypothetical protein [Solirubrobacteraceae bacterium]